MAKYTRVEAEIVEADRIAAIAILCAALLEACAIGMRINEQAGAAGDADDVRLAELRKLAEEIA